MRIRTIKPAFFSSPTLHRLSPEARLTFIGLWCYADDEGRGRDDARLIRSAVWPFGDRSVPKIDRTLADLAVENLICRYETDGNRLLHVVNWAEHQTIRKRYSSRLPACSRPEHDPRENGVSGILTGRNRERNKEIGVTGRTDPSKAGSASPLKGTPLDPEVIAACRFCDEAGWLWEGDVVRGRCSHTPQFVRSERREIITP